MAPLPKIEVKNEPGQPFKKLEPANDNHGIRLLSFEEFKAQENGTAESVIKGLVRTGTLIAVGGRPGAGKTALMVAIADALDKGEPFLGRETKLTTIAYVAAEDGGDVANRLEAIGNASIKIVKSPEGFPLTKPEKAAAIARTWNAPPRRPTSPRAPTP